MNHVLKKSIISLKPLSYRARISHVCLHMASVTYVPKTANITLSLCT